MKEDCKSMNPYLVLVFAFLLFCDSSIARDPQWFQRRMNDLDKVLQNTNEVEKIAALGGFIGIGRYGPTSMDNEQKTIFDKAQSGLLAIPGHAKYYQEKIEQTRALFMHYESLPQDERRKIEDQFRKQQRDLGKESDYYGMRQDGFNILGLLPSPETVAVLGHFLEDPEGLDGKDVLGNPIRGLPSCGIACNALSRLGIEHPPEPATDFADSLQYRDRVDVWKQWWQEIKSGKRTYRFKGSDIEYGPDGSATPEQIDKARQTQERDEKRAAGLDRRMSVEAVGEKEAETMKPSSLLTMLIAATAAVLVSIVWYLRRKRSVA